MSKRLVRYGKNIEQEEAYFTIISAFCTSHFLLLHFAVFVAAIVVLSFFVLHFFSKMKFPFEFIVFIYYKIKLIFFVSFMFSDT